MKKMMTALIALIVMTVSAKAMSYEQARQQALFLTDKMAYELNLNDAQYEAAYEINLDYLMGVNTYDDLYGTYWTQRNLDLSYIMLDWQYRAFCAASYFYRPLYWDGGYWHFGIYARYPHRDYFFFDRPSIFVSYHGGHSWGHNGGNSWYRGRDFGPRGGRQEVGMRDRFDRGDFGQGRTYGNRQARPVGNGNVGQSNGQGRGNFGQSNGQGRGNGTFGNRTPNQQSQPRTSTTLPGRTTNVPGRTNSVSGRANFGNRESSTRTTVTQPGTVNNNRSVFGGNRGGMTTSTPNRTFTPSNQGSSSFGNRGGSMSTRSVGTPSGGNRGGGSFGGGSHGGGSHGGGGSFGGRR